MSSFYPVRPFDEVCEEIESGSYTGHFSRQVWADILVALKSMAVAAGDQPQTEGLTLVRYCEPVSGTTTGFAALVLDEETNAVTTIYFDGNLNPAAAVPAGEPCSNDDWEYKWSNKCYQVIGDPATQHERMTCIPLQNGQPGAALNFWLLADGTVATTAPVNIEPCSTTEPVMVCRSFC